MIKFVGMRMEMEAKANATETIEPSLSHKGERKEMREL